MNKNFIVKIANGFGNQMFLYATAYAFSKKLGYKLLIDDETGIIHFLMRQCKYFIVGPTSFHWWAAWLCNKDGKIIVRPKDNELNQSSNADFWPESWIKI